MRDPRQVLGVSSTATPKEIKRAYRKKARENHSDKNPSVGAQKRMSEINGAYEALKNPKDTYTPNQHPEDQSGFEDILWVAPNLDSYAWFGRQIIRILLFFVERRAIRIRAEALKLKSNLYIERATLAKFRSAKLSGLAFGLLIGNVWELQEVLVWDLEKQLADRRSKLAVLLDPLNPLNPK